jgi:hypothetical protein
MNDDIDPELKSTLKWAKETSHPKPPVGLDTRIIARLEAEERQRSRRPWLWGLSGGLATALVVGLVIVSSRDIPKKEALYSPATQWRPQPGAPAAKKNEIGLKRKAMSTSEDFLSNAPVETMAAPQSRSLNDQIISRGTVEKNVGAGLRRQGFATIQKEAGNAAALPDTSPRVIRIQSQWMSVWGAPPTVDFSKQIVLVVFDGKILSHKTKNGQLEVEYRRLTTFPETHPSDWLAVPVFNGPVEFLLANHAE